MEPIVGRVGPFLIYGYTAVLASSIALALALTHWLTRRTQAFAAIPGWIDGVLAALVGAFLVGHAGFVAGEWAYFAERPSQIWQVWRGGFSFHGALLGGVAGLWVWTVVGQKRPFAAYANLLAPALALVNAGGWLACWMEGCAYGRETVYTGQWWHDWLAADLPDTLGLFALRYQTQLLGAALGLLALLLALTTIKREKVGGLFWLVLLLISISHLLVSLLRGDPAPQLAGARLDTWLNAWLALISVIQYWRVKRDT